jgi:hypothetical protein
MGGEISNRSRPENDSIEITGWFGWLMYVVRDAIRVTSLTFAKIHDINKGKHGS